MADKERETENCEYVEWSGKDDERGCFGPLVNLCEKCPHFKTCINGFITWYAKVPYFLLELYFRELKPTEFKVLVYLIYRSRFRKGDKHFGRCWATYGQIEEETGVKASNMSRYIKSLVKLGLITHSIAIRSTKYGPKTIHHFTITWPKRIADLEVVARKKGILK